MVFLSAALPVDPGLLIKLLGTMSTILLGWIVARSQPPQSGGAIFIGYHRGAIRVLTGLTLTAVIACVASFWWGPPPVSGVLIFLTLQLSAFAFYVLRLGLVYSAEGMLIRGVLGSWRPQKWSDVDYVRIVDGSEKLRIGFRDGSKAIVTTLMPGWEDFLATLERRSGERIPPLHRRDGEVFDLVPHPRGPEPSLAEAVEDRLKHEYRRGASQLLEDLRARSLTGGVDSDALAHLAILHLMAGDHALLPELLEAARRDLPGLLAKAGLAKADWRQVLRRRGTI